ncbi:MAG: tetratricopeptide repeat protein [Blastocatellia bacterium]|nr:tetratricopeptide repeat protein [Blastocatellia bacterium]
MWDAAADAYRRSIALNPLRPEAHTRLANLCLFILGKPDEAIESLNAALELDPTDVQVRRRSTTPSSSWSAERFQATGYPGVSPVPCATAHGTDALSATLRHVLPTGSLDAPRPTQTPRGRL